MSARISIENYIDACTDLAVSPSAASSMPVTNVQLAARDRVYRSTGVHDVVITGTWDGAGRRPTCFGMFRHRAHGGQIRVQLYSDAALTTGIYDSGTVDIFTDMVLGSEIDWGRKCPFLPEDDRLAYLAPYLLFFTEPAESAAGFAITFTDCPAGYWEIGRLWLGAHIEFTYNAMRAEMAPMTTGQAARTRGGSNRTSAGEIWRELSLNFDFITEAQRPIVADAARRVGTHGDVVLSLLHGYATARETRDHIVNGKFRDLAPLSWASTVRATRLTITEN